MGRSDDSTPNVQQGMTNDQVPERHFDIPLSNLHIIDDQAGLAGLS
jgi:hypothetical protein